MNPALQPKPKMQVNSMALVGTCRLKSTRLCNSAAQHAMVVEKAKPLASADFLLLNTAIVRAMTHRTRAANNEMPINP